MPSCDLLASSSFFLQSRRVFFSQILIIYRFLSVFTRSRCHTYSSKLTKVDIKKKKTRNRWEFLTAACCRRCVEDLSSFSNYQNAKLDLRSSPKISFSFQASSSIIKRLMTSFHLWKTVENVFSAVEKKINETKGKVFIDVGFSGVVDNPFFFLFSADVLFS